jgi:hypothetical protein
MKYYVVGSIEKKNEDPADAASPSSRMKIQDAAERLGKAIAKKGIAEVFITTLREDSVELYVVEGIVKELKDMGKSDKTKIKLIVYPDDEVGEVLDSCKESWKKDSHGQISIEEHEKEQLFAVNCICAVKSCDVVLTLGGRKNTLYLGAIAARLTNPKPVLPIKWFGGDSVNVWKDISQNGKDLYGPNFDHQILVCMRNEWAFDKENADEILKCAETAYQNWRRADGFYKFAGPVLCLTVGVLWTWVTFAPEQLPRFTNTPEAGNIELFWVIICAVLAATFGTMVSNIRHKAADTYDKILLNCILAGFFSVIWTLFYINNHLSVAGVELVTSAVSRAIYGRFTPFLSLHAALIGYFLDAVTQKIPHLSDSITGSFK